MTLIEQKKHYTIGQVVEKLKESFSDISISKVRFLEEEGLIKPERTKGGYRKFSDSDLQKLKSILTLQKDQYLPLSVIKRNIKLVEDGINSSSSTNRKHLEEAFYLHEPKKVKVSDESKVSKKQLDELSKYLTIDLNSSDGDKVINELDVELLDITKSLSKFGIEPRHLRSYDNFSDKEALMIYQIVAPLVKNKKMVEEKVSDLTRTLGKLKKILLKRALLKQFNK